MGDIRDRVMDRIDDKYRPASSEAKAWTCKECGTVEADGGGHHPACPMRPYGYEPPPTPAEGLNVELWEALAYFEMSGSHWRDRDTVQFAAEQVSAAIDRQTPDLTIQLAYEAGFKAGKLEQVSVAERRKHNG